MGQGYLKDGWKHKYVIRKANGKPLDPEAKYFVLRYDAPGGDPNARAAMRAYAVNVRRVNEKLANDVLERVEREEKKVRCTTCDEMGIVNRGQGPLTIAGSMACPKCKGTGLKKPRAEKKEKR